MKGFRSEVFFRLPLLLRLQTAGNRGSNAIAIHDGAGHDRDFQ